MNTQLSFSPIRVKTSPAQHWLANSERLKHGCITSIVKLLGAVI
jgi:hypothetical protein